MYKKNFLGIAIVSLLMFPIYGVYASTNQSPETEVSITIIKSIPPLEHGKPTKNHSSTIINRNKNTKKLPKTNEKSSIVPYIIGSLLLVLVSGIYTARVIRLIWKKTEGED